MAEATFTRGVCHALFAYDIGFSIDLDAAERLITAVKQRETIKHRRRAPQYFQYQPAPLRVTLTTEPVALRTFSTGPTVDLVLYDFGAVSVAYEIPLSGSLSGLLPLSDELYDNAELQAASRRYVEQLIATIRASVGKPLLVESVEDYVIYQIDAFSPSGGDLSAIIDAHAQTLAQLLRAERQTLSPQEVADAVSQRLSFGQNDLTVVDWNAALVVGGDSEDVRTVLEFANVELLEMRFLDKQLDETLAKSYEALSKRNWLRRILLGTHDADVRLVARLQAENAMLFEGVNNALKLLGDQYLARVYRLVSQRFHLNEWDAAILRKLETVESIYDKMTDELRNRRMEILEWIIIVLFVVSISLEVLALVGMKH